MLHCQPVWRSAFLASLVIVWAQSAMSSLQPNVIRRGYVESCAHGFAPIRQCVADGTAVDRSEDYLFLVQRQVKMTLRV